MKTNQKVCDRDARVDGPDVAPCSHAPADCAAMKELLEDDGDWLIP
jgi:hypothetical protein